MAGFVAIVFGSLMVGLILVAIRRHFSRDVNDPKRSASIPISGALAELNHALMPNQATPELIAKLQDGDEDEDEDEDGDPKRGRYRLPPMLPSNRDV